MAKILLSPIGRSPGAVTGIYHALSKQKPPTIMNAVVLISTTMARVQRSAQIVRQTIGEDRVRVLSLRSEGQPSHDFNDEATILDFIHQVNAVLDHAVRAGNEVYIGISGGRSSMGALATLSAYVYGAAGVYHLWVDESIERQGDIDHLPRLPSQRDQILRPPSDKYKLMSLPLASFDQLWDRGELGQALAQRPDAREALLRAVTDVEKQQLEALQEQQEASFEDVAAQIREIFENTEIEEAVEIAIKMAGGDEKPLEWEVAFKPYVKPRFWEQVKRDLSDWESWKAGGDRLLKTVEAIATPLTVTGLAALWGIPLK